MSRRWMVCEGGVQVAWIEAKDADEALEVALDEYGGELALAGSSLTVWCDGESRTRFWPAGAQS